MADMQDAGAASDGAVELARLLAPEGGEVRSAAPQQRPTTQDIERARRIEEVSRFAADKMLGGLLGSYMAHHNATLGHLDLNVPEVAEVRQLVAMADRLGLRAAAHMSVAAERAPVRAG